MESCPICLCELKGSENYITKCCKKQFHKNCFVDCMKCKQECPLCRSNQREHVIIIVQEQQEPVIIEVKPIYFPFMSIFIGCVMTYYFYSLGT
jgi:hypothetical protein